LVSIVVSTSPRFFARVLRRMDNPAHAATGGQRSAWSMRQRAQEGQNQWGLEALPRSARVQWPPPRPRARQRTH